MKLKEIKRYHVFHYANDNRKALYLMNENHVSENGKTHYLEWHRIYQDGRLRLQGTYTYEPDCNQNEVVDLGEFYDWMKKNHPIRYKRENWEASKPKEVL